MHQALNLLAYIFLKCLYGLKILRSYGLTNKEKKTPISSAMHQALYIFNLYFSSMSYMVEIHRLKLLTHNEHEIIQARW